MTVSAITATVEARWLGFLSRCIADLS